MSKTQRVALAITLFAASCGLSWGATYGVVKLCEGGMLPDWYCHHYPMREPKSCALDVGIRDYYFNPNDANLRCRKDEVEVRDQSGHFIRCMNW